MIVFKGFLRLLKRNRRTVMMFLMIFIGMAIMAQLATGKNQAHQNFESSKLPIAVTDADQSTLSMSLMAYLKKTQVVKTDIPVATSDQIQEQLYYGTIYSVIKIPKGFEMNYLSKGIPLKIINKPGFESAYVTHQVNNFLSQVKVMVASGLPILEAVQKVTQVNQKHSNVRLVSQSKTADDLPFHNYLFRYLPYILISMACYSLGIILIAYAEPNRKNRMMCSPVSYNAMNLQLLLGAAVIGIGLWLICALILPTVLSAKSFYSDPNLPYYLINITLMVLSALAISFFLSKWIRRVELISGITNVVALGMSFLCGVFVPLSILSPTLKQVTQFLPVYWYEVNNDLIGYHTDLNGAQLMSLYKGFGIQLLFILALICLGMLAGKMRAQEK